MNILSNRSRATGDCLPHLKRAHRAAAVHNHRDHHRSRRRNRIRSIQASLAIKNNNLSVEQVTAVLAGKSVLAAPRAVQEVCNAFVAYERLPRWQPAQCAHLLEAHRLLMTGLIDTPGRWRGSGVGIYRNKKLVHMAPPPSRVAKLMQDLLSWLKSTDAHPLISSCVFHYEFEFIHPFADGSGRLGRLWQTLILSRWKPVLAWLPVETVIRQHQSDYRGEVLRATALMQRLGLKHRPSFRLRYLLPAIHAHVIEPTIADAPQSPNQKYRKR